MYLYKLCISLITVMVQRKKGLWLHRPKRRVLLKRSKRPPDSQIWEPSPKKLNLMLSPASTPKRRRFLSPLVKNDVISPAFSFRKSTSNRKVRKTCQIDIVLQKLDTVGKGDDFRAFLDLVEHDNFPLDNISFLLFLETTRFFF